MALTYSGSLGGVAGRVGFSGVDSRASYYGVTEPARQRAHSSEANRARVVRQRFLPVSERVDTVPHSSGQAVNEAVEDRMTSPAAMHAKAAALGKSVVRMTACPG